MKHYHVVAAVITYGHKILCMQKGQTQYPYTSYKFEFPGGKVEPGETSEEALLRELREEMDYQVSIERPLVTVSHSYPDFSITMEAFVCRAGSPDFKLKEHHDFRWLPVGELASLDWAAADIGIVQTLLQESVR